MLNSYAIRFRYMHWQAVRSDGSTGCPLWKTGSSARHADPGWLQHGEERWFRVDMPTLKAALRQILAQYNPPMPFPAWIQDHVGTSHRTDLIYWIWYGLAFDFMLT